MKISTPIGKEAVSPVIGVILMVMITVVLAAVFYLWVIGFIGGGAKETPKVTFSVKEENGNYTVTVLSVSRGVSVYDANFFITDSTGKTVKDKDGSGYLSEIYGKDLTVTKGNISFLDKNKDEKLSVDDYFIIKAKNEYHVFRLTYISTGNIMGEIKLS